ncbi:MAG: hypothetical protein KC492_38390 [Myxococcales bacterium]|nr:hypothetical protein [Myxococcales bacterium]MCA9646638.1 hypothetical protein [Myxococcales bacterium]
MHVDIVVIGPIEDAEVIVLTADGDPIAFYASVGFERAGNTVPMWMYAGNEH